MKNIYSILLIAILGVSICFTSCKEEEVEAEPLPQAVIKGTVKAELDNNSAGLESAPNGTKLIFRINSRDLVLNPITGYSYKTLQYTATVNNGSYTISLPSAIHAGVNVDIVAVDFKANQTQSDASTVEKTYVGGTTTISTQADEVYFINLTYNPI
jgi:hypothetical protein